MVGPESAGANPGPACYGKGVVVCVCGGKLIHQNDSCLPALCVGGPLTVTDANLCLGRLLPE